LPTEVRIDQNDAREHIGYVSSKKDLEKLRREVQERREKTAALNERVRRFNESKARNIGEPKGDAESRSDKPAGQA
jgi:hypothetical protein